MVDEEGHYRGSTLEAGVTSHPPYATQSASVYWRIACSNHHYSAWPIKTPTQGPMSYDHLE
jgi:hypothetical protein